jgi:hypothetical protein
MTFHFDDETGVMRIAFADEAGPCMYVETPIGIFRIERSSHQLISIAIPAFYKKVANGTLSLPDLSSTTLTSDIIDELRARR